MRYLLTQDEYLRRLAAARRHVRWLVWLVIGSLALLAIDGAARLYCHLTGIPTP